MTAKNLNRISWKMTRDKDGHRDYHVRQLVATTTKHDGPAVVMNTPGLFAIGAPWSFENESDPWAFCWPTMTVNERGAGQDPGHAVLWEVEQLFTTKPLSRCQDTSIENPIDEPPRMGGSFVKYVQEADRDRFGNVMANAVGEPFRGKQTEKDFNRPTVEIELTLTNLPLTTFTPMVDTVNDAQLWGLDPRKIKLSNASWRRHLYGTCTYYFTVKYDFDIDFKTFDREIANKGTRVVDPTLKGVNLDLLKPGSTLTYRQDPASYLKVKDTLEENKGSVFLDADGFELPAGAAPIVKKFELYDESDFLLLGIPATIP